jgi:uncharacterized membrane protein
MNITTSGIGGLAVLVALAGVATTIFWMFVGWRAMEAHERLAKAAEDIARKMRDREDQPTKSE